MDSRIASKDEIIRICSNPNRVNYVCMLLRPGFYGWMVELEYTRFKPDTDENDGFHLLLAAFPDKEPIPYLTLGVVSIDRSGQEYAEKLLWDHGLKKIGPNMAFTLAGPNGVEQFFLHGPNTFVLENHNQGAEHVVYLNDEEKMEKAREHEFACAQRFFDEHEQWINTPEGKAIADAYWSKHPSGKVY